jgi:hypothetical protein
MEDQQLSTVASVERQSPVGEPQHEIPESGAVYYLKVLAWLNLIAGEILGLWIIDGVQGKTEANPAGIALGVGLMLEGMLVCAFLLVVCSMAQDLRSIRIALKGEPLIGSDAIDSITGAKSHSN